MCVLFLLLTAAPVWAAPEGWKEGGATYFDAPAYWKAAFIPGKFGDLYGNSCGYVDRIAGEEPSNAGFPFPFDAVGAVSDSMPEHTGSCGRCYEIRCKTGLVLSGDGMPSSIYEGYYLPTYAPDLLDPEGRPWPGKPEKYAEMKYTQCWEGGGSIVITTIDSCPCVYIGGRKQSACCGPRPHFDLSFWAFDKLAHPLYGNMQIEYRPVDCVTHEPLDLENPFISDIIYGDGPGAGWGWRTYGEQMSTLLAQNEGINNSTATCVDLTPGGGLGFHCRGCHEVGFQPFNNTDFIEFWIRSRSKETKSQDDEGDVLGLQMFLSQMHTLVYNETGSFRKHSAFCDNKPALADYISVGGVENWLQIEVPLADFRCGRALEKAKVNKIVIENPTERNIAFCLDEFRIV